MNSTPDIHYICESERIRFANTLASAGIRVIVRTLQSALWASLVFAASFVAIFLCSIFLSVLPACAEGQSTDLRDLNRQIAGRLSTALRLDKAEAVQTKLRRFEQRALPTCGEQEIRACYSTMLQALEKNNNEEGSATDVLCWHLLVELADPSQVNQGRHNTCALSALESFLYAREPALVCNIVLQAAAGRVALDGGRVIELPEENLGPDHDALLFEEGGSNRSYASQLFQLAAANIYWQNQSEDPYHVSVPKGSIRYVQDFYDGMGTSSDSGERLLIHWSRTRVEQVTNAAARPESSPCFTFDAVGKTYKLMKGRGDLPFMLEHKQIHVSKRANTFDSRENLANHLQQLKRDAAFPAMISVNLQSAQFSRKPLALNGAGPARNACRSASRIRWHVVCINDFDSETGRVAIDNFWGPHADRLGEKGMMVDDLFAGASPQLEMAADSSGAPLNNALLAASN